MKEYITEAFVLGVKSRGGDRVADLFTLGLGRVEARMVAGRSIVSKFSPHCDPLNLLMVRLVKKKRYTLADVITEDRFSAVRRSPRALESGLEALLALRMLVPKEEPDPRLFHESCRALSRGHFTARETLTLLGYDPRAARCAQCRKPAVHVFIPEEGIFFCRACSPVRQEGFVRKGDKVVLNV